MQTKIKYRRNRQYAAPVGGVLIVFALIGVITVIITCINLTVRVLDNSNEKEKLAGIVRPVLMFDPVPFENPADIDPQSMLLYCMWANLGSEKSNSYSYDENAELIVPASDLEVAAARLFGSEVTLQHQTFRDYGNYQTHYYYDAERNIYNVPVSAQLYVYSAQVEDIQRSSGNLYDVTVGYIPPSGDAWTTDFLGNKETPEPDKYMVYVMEKNGGDYRIVAIRDVESGQPAEPGRPAA